MFLKYRLSHHPRTDLFIPPLSLLFKVMGREGSAYSSGALVFFYILGNWRLFVGGRLFEEIQSDLSRCLRNRPLVKLLAVHGKNAT